MIWTVEGKPVDVVQSKNYKDQLSNIQKPKGSRGDWGGQVQVLYMSTPGWHWPVWTGSGDRGREGHHSRQDRIHPSTLWSPGVNRIMEAEHRGWCWPAGKDISQEESNEVAQRGDTESITVHNGTKHNHLSLMSSESDFLSTFDFTRLIK